MRIFILEKNLKEQEEIVEKKGLGHPDTLADDLAERLSVKYANYTLYKYGAILHHNFDKLGLLGGAVYVRFGKGHLVKPIKVLLTGRASTKFGKENIPVKKLLTEWTRDFFKERLPLIDVNKDLAIHFYLSTQSSPGKTEEKKAIKGARKFWFKPRGLKDLPELKRLFANDTSLGVGYAPPSVLEKFVVDIENSLNSEKFKKENPWIGSDIKILGFCYHNDVYITLCIPQIAHFVKNLKEYKKNLKKARHYIQRLSKKYLIKNLKIYINTRDDFRVSEIYLTAIGSSIESGDEGLVGRGNRINGIISPTKPMAIEGSKGKNPVYHVGKLYYICAFKLAEKIYQKYKIHNEVYLLSQSGRDLLDPWVIVVNIPHKAIGVKKEIKKLINREIKKMPLITKELLQNKTVPAYWR